MVQGVGYSGSGYYPRKKKEDNTTKVVLGTLITAAAVAAGAYYCGRNSINAKSYLTGDEFTKSSVWKTVDKKGQTLTRAGEVLKSKQVMSNVSTLTADKVDNLGVEAKKVWEASKNFRSNGADMKFLKDLTWYEKFYNSVNKFFKIGIYKEGAKALPKVKGWNA